MSLDEKFISAIVKEQNLLIPYDRGITEDHLFGVPRNMYGWLKVRRKALGTVPSKVAVEHEFGITLPDPDDSLDHYCDELIRRGLGNTIGDGLKSVIAKLKARDPFSALTELKVLTRQAARTPGGALKHVMDLRLTVPERLKEYDRVAAIAGGIDGITSPWHELDVVTQGFRPGELSVIVARTGVGKTFALIALLKHIVENNIPALFLAMEMGGLRIARRFDAMYSSVPWDDFRKGLLSSTHEATLRSKLDELAKRPSPVYMAGASAATSVGDLDILVDELEPKIVLVDGLYLMKDDRGKLFGWERVSDVIDNLCLMATSKNVPVVTTTQFHRKVSSEATSARLENIAYADRIGQNADTVIALFRDKLAIEANVMYMDLIKAREAKPCSMMLNWDLDMMDFSVKAAGSALRLEEDDEVEV